MDPTAVLTEPAPAFADAEAVEIAAARYGLDVTVSPLVSERDQNFRLRASDGREFVLKIANSAEDRVATDFQIRALIHIAERVRREGLPVNAPEIVPTVDGDTHIIMTSAAGEHVARIVTFLPGVPLENRIATPGLAHNAGAFLAHLGIALQGFEHPGSRHGLLWDIQRALELRPLMQYIPDPKVAANVAAALDEYEAHCLPVLPDLRAQVIHSDLNPDNLILESADSETVAGVIDFGDMLHAPLVADVAIACSYQRVVDGDPLFLIAEFVAGYQGVTPLHPEELEILFELIKARLCASIVILDWRAAGQDGKDEYLENRVVGEGSAMHFLEMLSEIPRDHAIRLFRQIRASVDDQPLS